MKRPNTQVMHLLEESYPQALTAHQIVRRTKLSFSTVRATLSLSLETRQVERELDMGLNGHTLYLWRYTGVALVGKVTK